MAPRKNPNPYTCPACEYTTFVKTDMRKHLYKTKPCPSVTGIRLNDEIKEDILQNRIYHPPNKSQTATHINNTINYNIFSSMPLSDQISTFTNFNNTEMIDFDTKCYDEFVDKRMEIENDTEYDVAFEDMLQHSTDEILDIIDRACRVNKPNFEDFSIYYDKLAERVSVYDQDEWKKTINAKGAGILVKSCKVNYFDYYENYLIRRNRLSRNLQLRQKALELITEYYKFIAIFDLEPGVCDQSDRDILYNGSSTSTDVSSEFMDLYKKTKATIKAKDRNSILNKVIRIIANNTKANVNDFEAKMKPIIPQLCNFAFANPR